jgi:hypothetical protein
MSRAALPAGPRFVSPRMWFFFSDPRSFYAWLRGRYGELVTMQVDGAQFVLALTAEGARQVLTKDPGGYDAFHKEAFAGLAGAGSLWVLDGARHRRERQLLLPQFTAHRVRNHGQIIAGATRRHIDGWRVGQHMRAYDAMLDISLDVILHVMFGSARGASSTRDAGPCRSCCVACIRCLILIRAFRGGGFRRGSDTGARNASFRPLWRCTWRSAGPLRTNRKMSSISCLPRVMTTERG